MLLSIIEIGIHDHCYGFKRAALGTIHDQGPSAAPKLT